jgi:hypothetical protein
MVHVHQHMHPEIPSVLNLLCQDCNIHPTNKYWLTSNISSIYFLYTCFPIKFLYTSWNRFHRQYLHWSLKRRVWNTCPIFMKLGMSDIPFKAIPKDQFLFVTHSNKNNGHTNSGGCSHSSSRSSNELRAAHNCTPPSSSGQHLVTMNNVRLGLPNTQLSIHFFMPAHLLPVALGLVRPRSFRLYWRITNSLIRAWKWALSFWRVYNSFMSSKCFRRY